MQQFRNWSSHPTVDGWSQILGHQAADGVYLPVQQPNGQLEMRLDTSYYSDADRAFWEQLNNTPGYPGTGEGNLMVALDHASAERESITKDRRFFSSLTLLFATPKDFGPLNGRALGNLRANLVYRLFTGTPFEGLAQTVNYANLQQQAGLGLIKGTRYGPMHTRVDLNLEKSFVFHKERSLTLAVETFNLFNQRDVRSYHPENAINFKGADWLLWGLTGARPTDADLLTFGETFDINNYYGMPRTRSDSACG